MNSARLATIDWLILGGYFVLIVAVGVVAARFASRSISDYFLGGRRIPWWVLGMSGSASNFDMTGTMIITSFFYVIGFQGFWVESRGGLVLGLCVLLAFMGKWLRRSRVMTTAEWMELRFGTGRGGQLARVLAAAANLVFTIGMVIYFAKGSGKFVATFLPFSPEACALGMIAICLLYTAMSGLYGVIYTDVLQEILLFSVAAFIIVKAAFLPEHDAVIAAAGADWIDVTPRWTAEPMYWLDNPLIYQMFGVSILFWVAKSLIEGLGGHTGYMSQRFFAARDERSAGLMTAEWTALLSVRFAMVAGIALLGLWLAQHDPEVARQLSADPERTLPVVFSHVLPAGVLGFALAGMMSAAMSTFDSTINAGASYWVRDIYQRFLRPEADEKALVRQSYFATISIALLGVVLAMAVKNINEIWNLMTGPLGTAFVVPMAMRWYWWRFNGYGYAWSIGVGMLTAILLDVFVPGLAFFESTGITFMVSVTIGVVVSLLTPAPNDEVLRRFYRQIRPFGFWGRFAIELDETESDSIRSENRLGLLNMVVALAWQLCLFITVIAAVWHNWQAVYPALTAFLILSLMLYFFWYRNLSAAGVGADDRYADESRRDS
jgi:solute:Na+ symporter, SSS family